MPLGPRVFLIRFSTAFAKPSSNHLSPKKRVLLGLHISHARPSSTIAISTACSGRAPPFQYTWSFLPSQAAVRRSIGLSISGQVEDPCFTSACGDHRDSQPKQFGQTIVQLTPVPVPHAAVYEGIGCLLEVRRV